MRKISLPDKITIACDRGDEVVNGRILPGRIFAITRLHGIYSLTHIPSWRYIIDGNFYDFTLKSATRAAKQFCALPIDWKKATPEYIRDLPPDLIEALRKIRSEAETA